MNIAKIKKSNTSIYSHVGDYETRAREPHIDHSRTHLNFNISDNYRDRNEQLDYIDRIVHKTTRQDSVVAFSVITTLPESYFKKCEDRETLYKFFHDIHYSVIEFFNLTEDDCVSSFVHLDERTPHMHEILTPILRREGERPVLNFDEVVPLKAYYLLHPTMNTLMKEKGWDDINLLCGDSEERAHYREDVRTIKKRLLMEKERDVKALSDEIARLKSDKDSLSSEISLMDSELIKKKKESMLLRLVSENEKAVIDSLNNNLLKFDKDTRKSILLLSDDKKADIKDNKTLEIYKEHS